MQFFADKFEQWTPSIAPHLAPAKGIIHCKWVATKLSVWVKHQGLSPQAIVLHPYNAISDAIETDDIWGPTLSEAFCTLYKVYDICYTAPPPPLPPPMPPEHSSAGLGGGGSTAGGDFPLPPPAGNPRVPLQAL